MLHKYGSCNKLYMYFMFAAEMTNSVNNTNNFCPLVRVIGALQANQIEIVPHRNSSKDLYGRKPFLGNNKVKPSHTSTKPRKSTEKRHSFDCMLTASDMELITACGVLLSLTCVNSASLRAGCGGGCCTGVDRPLPRPAAALAAANCGGWR